MENTAADAAAFARPYTWPSARANAATASRTNATAKPGAVGRRRGHCHRIADIRHGARQVNLGRDYDRWLRRQFWVVIAHNNHRRHDLLHGKLGEPALGRLQDVAITTTAATAGNRFRRRQRWDVIRGHQGYSGLRLGNLLHYVAPEQRTRDDHGYGDHMHDGGEHRTVFLVVVEAPN